MYSGDELYDDDVTSGPVDYDLPFEGELEQADFEYELERLEE